MRPETYIDEGQYLDVYKPLNPWPRLPWERYSKKKSMTTFPTGHLTLMPCD